MRVLLVDDEELALDVLQRLLMQIDGIEVVGKFTNPFMALEELSVIEADAVFLDLEMGGLHGLQFAHELLQKKLQPAVIFVTAYAQYAVDAFEVDALDYLLKPVTLERLKKAVQKIEASMKIKEIKKVHINDKTTDIYIRSLGTFQIQTGEGDTTVRWRTKKVKEMFCFLWLNNEQPVYKHRLLEELWPEVAPDKGAALLHTTVYQLRKTLKEMGFEEGIQYINDHYVLTLPFKSDLEELKYLLEKTAPTTEDIKRLLTIYEGDLFEQDEYNWCIYEQQNLRNTYLDCLQRYTNNNIARSQNGIIEKCLLKLVQMDAYNERFVVLLINYYGSIGNTKGLIEAYEHYSNTVREELGIMPSRQVIEIYQHYIKRG